MSRALIQVEHLGAGYGDLQVLWDVNVCVAEGERVAIMGSNGAGKSTLLKTAAGALLPMSGRIVFDGREIGGIGPSARVRLGIALVPEGRRLFSGMTVRENLQMGAHTRTDRAGISRDLDWVLALFPALAGKLQQLAGTLSGGEQQMCSVGRALMTRPRLLLIDELSLGLAPALASRLLEAVMGLDDQRMAIVLVEQDVSAALAHSGRAYVMAGGRIVKEGPSGELAADPMIKKSYLGL